MKAEKGPKQFKKQFEVKSNDEKIEIKCEKKCEASHKEFLDLIYTKITKFIWNKRDEIKLAQQNDMDRQSIVWLDDVQKILQSICLLRIENQWVISNDLSDRTANGKYIDHLEEIVSFMTALVVVLSVKNAVSTRLSYQ